MTVPSIDIAPGGPRLSRIALGFWRLADAKLSRAELRALVEESLDLGITTFDHADIYGSYRCEEIFGEALSDRPALRDRMQLVTKCGIKLVSPNRPATAVKHYDTGAAHILASVDNSLRMLRTDHVDLLLIHRPDPFMDADETAGAFIALRAAGKVPHFGVSNFLPSQFELLASRLPFPLVTNQIEFSALNMEALDNGVLDQCQRLRIAPMAWSPLGGGKLLRGEGEQAIRVRQALAAIGEKIGAASIDQVALAWILNHPARIVPVLGTGKIDRVRSAASSAALTLSREQWFTVWRASKGRDVP
jgi:predicted oxidoreductase